MMTSTTHKTAKNTLPSRDPTTQEKEPATNELIVFEMFIIA